MPLESNETKMRLCFCSENSVHFPNRHPTSQEDRYDHANSLIMQRIRVGQTRGKCSGQDRTRYEKGYVIETNEAGPFFSRRGSEVPIDLPTSEGCLRVQNLSSSGWKETR